MLTNCKFFVAKTAGFCFGVDRAVKIVYNSLDNRCKVVTLGPIIHNKDVVSDFEAKGVSVIRDVSEAAPDMKVVIRSHGVGRQVYEELDKIGCEVVDATCPFVARIHKIALECSSDGCTVLIAGDKDHPEVIGIADHCVNKPYVFSDADELERIICEHDLKNVRTAVIAQTTYNTEMWKKCREVAEKELLQATVFDTICSATEERQREAAEIAAKSDIMLIVGGKHSSNTHKLAEICEKHCKTFLIENAQELYGINFGNAVKIGISAGASTPAYIIKEVQQTMSDILMNDEEFNWVEEMENSLKPIHIGKRVTGTVLSVSSKGAFVDLGTKQQGFVPADELSFDVNAKPEDIVKEGDEIDLIVLKTNDQEGMATLSKKKIDAAKGFEEVQKAYDEHAVLKGTVTNVVKGGVVINFNGVRVFVPASQATARRDDDLNELLKKEVEFKLLEVQANRQRAVGSIRAVAKEAREAAKAKFFENTKAGDIVTGTVKSITDYGVFVDLGGIDGLVRKPDLSWLRIKHPSDVVEIGQQIEVLVKDIDPETNKIALSYKKDSDNPWNNFIANYSVGQIIDAKIVSITSFGAFAQIIPGVDGLIHISQIANSRVNNVADVLKAGETVTVKITEINTEAHRISLSIRALLPVEEPKEAEEAEDTEAVEEAAEAVEETAEAAETEAAKAVEEAAAEEPAEVEAPAEETEDTAAAEE